MEKGKDKSIFSILSIVFCLIPIVLFFFGVSVKVGLIVSIIAIILEITAIVFAIIGLKSNKVLSIVSIVIGIILTLVYGFMLIGLSVISGVKDCVLSEDGKTATCNCMGQEMELPVEVLEDNQIKKDADAKEEGEP